MEKNLIKNLQKKQLKYDELIIICGRYEGVDQRFIDFNSIEEISIGDYVFLVEKFLH